MSTTIIDNAIKTFITRMVEAGYQLDEEGTQWVIDNLQDVFYPLLEQGSEQSASSQANEEIRGLLQQLVEQTPATPQSASPGKKRGLSGWNMFLRHMKETEPDEKHTFQSCSPLWKNMSAEEKGVFNQKAKEYNAKTPATPASSSGTPGKAKKPNAWNQFCKDFKVECDKKGVKYDVKKASEAYQKVKAQQQA